MIKLRKILTESSISDKIEFERIEGKSSKGIDTFYVPTKNTSFEKYKNYIKSNFINVHGYRGMKYENYFFVDDEIASSAIVNPRNDYNQKSVDSHTFYYILFDNLDSWSKIHESLKQYRSKSLKFTNSKDLVVSIYAQDINSVISRVYPKKDANILVSIDKKGYPYMPYLFKKIEVSDLNDAMSEVMGFLESCLDILRGKNEIVAKNFNKFNFGSNNPKHSKLIFDFLKDFKITNDEVDFILENSSSLMNEYLLQELKKQVRPNKFYTLLNDLFDPEKNEIHVMKADSNEFKKILSDDTTDYEFWTSDVCFMEVEEFDGQYGPKSIFEQ